MADSLTYASIAAPNMNQFNVWKDLTLPSSVSTAQLSEKTPVTWKSSDTTRLNETMLTIWTSDDNKTYTQVPAFKLLRDGKYTYLYDFEATARYIKVHCTSHYACYAHMTCLGLLDYYLDAFYINDTDNSYIPDVVVTAETAPLTEVPENLTETYADVTALTGAMQSTVLSEAGEGYTAENTAVYALSPIPSKDGGEWTAASAEDIPASGMTVMIAYPEGTAADTHAFRAADANGKSLSVAETENGLKIKVTDASPVILAWAETADEPIDIPAGGLPTGAWIGIGAGVIVIAVIAVVIISKSKKKSA